MGNELSTKRRFLAGLLVLSAGIEAIQTKRLELERTVVKSVPIDLELQTLRDIHNDLHNLVVEIPDETEAPSEVEAPAPVAANSAPSAPVAPAQNPPQPSPMPPASSPTPVKPLAPVPSKDSPVDPRGGGRSA